MLFSIGYQKLKDVDELISILRERKINILLDVRSRPYGRKPAFNKKNLEKTYRQPAYNTNGPVKPWGDFRKSRRKP
jgi:hypothetical protein